MSGLRSGLIQLYAIAYIQKHAPKFFDQVKPVNFVAMASPLLGLSTENPMYVRFAIWTYSTICHCIHTEARPQVLRPGQTRQLCRYGVAITWAKQRESDVCQVCDLDLFNYMPLHTYRSTPPSSSTRSNPSTLSLWRRHYLG